MNKEILIFNFSHRINGSTSILINRFEKELKKLNNKIDIKIINLISKNLEYFSYENSYSKKDKEIFEKLRNNFLKADIVIFASPIYWYGMSGSGKVFFDRLFMSLFGKEELTKNKKIGLLFTYSSKNFENCFIEPFEKTSKYLNMKFLGYFGVKSKYPIGIEKENFKGIDKFIKKIINEI